MPNGDWTLVTGATGFIGHFVLAELLRSGQRCVALVRPHGSERLLRLLCDAAPDVAPDRDRLRIAVGALPGALPALAGARIRRVVHVAGSTSFQRSGVEPARTNVEGTRDLLAWMDARGADDLTHVSTAYVCGVRRERILERIESTAPPFNNDYEQSKWQAEQLAARWAAGGGRRLAVVRPSIVAGEFGTGRATQFRGFYVLARAVEQLAQRYAGAARERRHGVRLRLPGNANDPSQLAPVDYVARAIAAIAADRAADGVYHLAHPRPPSNGEMKRWLECVFDVGGGTFVGDLSLPAAEQSAEERWFRWGVRALESYFAPTHLDCTRAAALLSRRGVECPVIDLAYVRRCVDYARACRWGRAAHDDAESRRYAGAYFERFLPAFLPHSRVGRMTPVRATIGFMVGMGEWVCRFEGGRLDDVRRGSTAVRAEFGYRTTPTGFWHAIGGETAGEALFASGEADVFGDVEAALKMSAILGEFTREFPCDRARLDRLLESAG